MRKAKILIGAAALSCLLALPAYAAEWKQDSVGWWWQNDDGSYPTSTWKEINGKQYYFGSDGYMYHDTTTPDGYTVGSDGAWIESIPQQTYTTNKISAPIDDEWLPFSFERNSVNGIKVFWMATNNSGKKINYYTLTLEFYNRVGDPAWDEIKNTSVRDFKYVGPVEPGGMLAMSKLVGYIPACHKVVISKINLEYADGTTETVDYGYSTTKELNQYTN